MNLFVTVVEVNCGGNIGGYMMLLPVFIFTAPFKVLLPSKILSPLEVILCLKVFLVVEVV